MTVRCDSTALRADPVTGASTLVRCARDAGHDDHGLPLHGGDGPFWMDREDCSSEGRMLRAVMDGEFGMSDGGLTPACEADVVRLLDAARPIVVAEVAGYLEASHPEASAALRDLLEYAGETDDPSRSRVG